MFKTGRWRSEKNKISALFRLQFHATGVAQVAGDSLVISLIPADVGKPTVRSEKAVIKEGNCYWEKPILESLRFFREPRTGKFQEKIYYFVVSNGWTKTDFVGEVSIDFATYAESFKVSSVSLPLKNSKCDALLHVSLQRVQEDVDQREIEEIESATTTPSNDRSLRAQLNNSDADERIKGEDTCAPSSPLYDEIPVAPEMRKTNRGSCGSDVTLSSSEGSYGPEPPAELVSKDNAIQRDPTSVLPTIDTSQPGTATSAPPADVAATDEIVPKPEPLTSTHACLETSQSGADMSTDTNEVEAPDYKVSKAQLLKNYVPEESTNGSSDSPIRDVFTVEKSEESSSLLINELRAEISTLRRKAEVAELELQTLRKSIVKESRKGQDLLREVTSLKDARKALRIECEKLKAKNKFEKGDPRSLIEELRQELNYEKERNANLRVQVMKMQESNSELILAIEELDEMLEQKDNELLNLSNSFKSETGDKEEKKIEDLCNELEMHKREKEELEGHIEQLVLDYEILKQENHDLLHQLEQSEAQEQLKLQYECSSSYATISGLEAHVENLENELKEQSSKFSESLTTIAELEEHAKSLLEDLEKQAQGFEDDIEILTRDRIELEKRAITAEEALRKTRWQNANTAEKIHEEFRRIYVEMSSTLDSNEKIAKKVLFEANELRMQKSHLEDLLMKSKEELHLLTEQYEANLNELTCQLSSKVSSIEQLENEKTRGEESKATLSNEIVVLKAEIETLKTENNSLSAEAEEKQSLRSEFDQMNVSMREMEQVLEKRNAENIEREREIVHLREEVQQLVNELNSTRKEKDEKEKMIHLLKEQYEANLNELSCQLISKVNCIEQLENEKACGEESNTTLSKEILTLKEKIESLKMENNSLYVEVEEKQNLKSEFEQVNVSMREMELAIEEEKAQSVEREREIIHLREEVQQLVNELNSLRKEKDEKEKTIHLLKEQYEANLNELSCQLISKVNCIEQLEKEKACGEESTTTLSKEILMLKEKIESLKMENNSLSAEVEEKQSLKSEFDQMNVSMREMELALEEEKAQSVERESEIIHLREEVQQFVNELNSLRKEKDEKEKTIHLLKEQYETNLNELSCQLISKVNCIEQLENEKVCGEESTTTLSKEILMLKEKIESLKMENNSLSAEVEEKQSLKSEFDQMNVSMREMELALEEEKAQSVERESEIIHLREEVQQFVNELYSMREEKDEKKITIEYVQSELKTLQNQHKKLKHLFSEDELEKNNLKNKIKSLEDQIKMKEDDVEHLTNSYSEKEKYLQKEMEMLEKRLKDSCAQKVDESKDAIFLDGNTCKVSNNTTEPLKTIPYLFSELGESPFSPKNTIDESSKEIVLLKERNKEMENELKEMQERYSEISLKLAEVEGSRQQLMMRVRNLKSAKKS